MQEAPQAERDNFQSADKLRTSWKDKQALYARVQSGDVYALELLTKCCLGMTEGCPNLVKVFLGDFLKSNPTYRYLSDDLMSAGNVAVIERINRLGRPHKQVRSVRSVLKTAAFRAFAEECNRAEVFGSRSLRTVRRRRKDEGDDESASIKRNPLPMNLLSAETAEERTELFDEIAACCEDDKDRSIVKLRLLGENDTQIASRLNVTQQAINLRRLAIERRFNERQQALSA